jgi:hypothetical protein
VFCIAPAPQEGVEQAPREGAKLRRSLEKKYLDKALKISIIFVYAQFSVHTAQFSVHLGTILAALTQSMVDHVDYEYSGIPEEHSRPVYTAL